MTLALHSNNEEKSATLNALFVFITRSRVLPPLNVTNDTETLFTFFVTVYLDIWLYLVNFYTGIDSDILYNYQELSR